MVTEELVLLMTEAEAASQDRLAAAAAEAAGYTVRSVAGQPGKFEWLGPQGIVSETKFDSPAGAWCDAAPANPRCRLIPRHG